MDQIQNKQRYFVIGDIHGMFNLLMDLIKILEEKAGFSLEKGDILIQLGDRNDRGPDTYKVNEYFKNLQLMWPGQIIVLMGNHDRMLLDACDDRSDLMYYNGGNKTEKSYADVSKIYGSRGFGNSVRKVGHYDWLKRCPLFYETPDYFFSHAPIALGKYYEHRTDFRWDEHALTWTFIDGIPVLEWVDGKLIPKEYGDEWKITVHGHIHSGTYNKTTKLYETPNPVQIDNAILIDTGSGCWQDAVLTALELPSLNYYQSNGYCGNMNE